MTKAALLIAAILSFAESPARADDPALVDTVTRLNLRTCPATVGCGVLRTLESATRLEVLEHQEEWLQVRVTNDGDHGWVHSAYVTAVVDRSHLRELASRPEVSTRCSPYGVNVD